MDNDFDDQKVDAIAQDKELNQEAIDIENQFRTLELEEAKNAMSYRSDLYKWGIRWTTSCLAASALYVIASAFFSLNTRIGVAFIASLAVEVVGIVVVIAKYFFPDHGVPHSRKRVKKILDSDLDTSESS